MLNALKNAALFTALYFVIFHVVFWTVLFLMITVQAFWKLFVAVFLIALAICTFDYVKAHGGVKNVFTNYKLPTFSKAAA